MDLVEKMAVDFHVYGACLAVFRVGCVPELKGVDLEKFEVEIDVHVGKADTAFACIDLERQVAQIDAVQDIPGRRELEVERRVCKVYDLADDIAEREVAEPCLEDRAGLGESRREAQRDAADTEVAEHGDFYAFGGLRALHSVGALVALGRLAHRSVAWLGRFLGFGVGKQQTESVQGDPAHCLSS